MCELQERDITAGADASITLHSTLVISQKSTLKQSRLLIRFASNYFQTFDRECTY